MKPSEYRCPTCGSVTREVRFYRYEQADGLLSGWLDPYGKEYPLEHCPDPSHDAPVQCEAQGNACRSGDNLTCRHDGPCPFHAEANAQDAERDVEAAYGTEDALDDLNALACLVNTQVGYGEAFIKTVHDTRFVPLTAHITAQDAEIARGKRMAEWLAMELENRSDGLWEAWLINAKEATDE